MRTTLLTKALRAKLPPLYANETVADPVAVVKFFSPYNGWTWYATEFDGEDTFFGLVKGFETELGYFSLSELESVKFKGVVPAVERDRFFSPTPLSELRK